MDCSKRGGNGREVEQEIPGQQLDSTRLPGSYYSRDFLMIRQETEIETRTATEPVHAARPLKSETITLSILLPVRNEGINLRIMVKLLKAMVEVPHELLIVYDFPDDDSIAITRNMQNQWANLRLVHNQRGRGVVNAIQAGVDAAVG